MEHIDVPNRYNGHNTSHVPQPFKEAAPIKKIAPKRK